ncbi:MAG: vitamin B12 dependent-methionine synthase activation domain-containing protein, partial [Pseudomonadota bacterium]
KSVRAPIMIDSTDERVTGMALTYLQGKAIINSINLENGEDRFRKVVPLAKIFGAALVVGTIDENPTEGMALTRSRKLEIARRSYDLLTGKYDIEPENILFDPLVFPCASGDPAYAGSAVETMEALRLLKKAFPRSKTLLGISNVSFGLPEAGREILNSVFLYHCTQAGLDVAIVNTNQLRRFASIPEDERTVAEDLLWNRGEGCIERFNERFRTRAAPKKEGAPRLQLEDRLARCVIEGTREGLAEDLDEALRAAAPIEIINGPLMKGMNEVGRLFNKNELIVAEVLQSAEVMKFAVEHLKKFMSKSQACTRGKVLLATVKGDVHDIGKNLVEMILTGSGFEVVDLGIRVTTEALIAAVKEHHPQILGLSGLLVKSAHQMTATAEDLAKAGVKVPMLVGGAALTRSFVDRKIAKAYAGMVAYASDAMNGLELANIVVDPAKFERFKTELEKSRAARVAGPQRNIDASKEPPPRSAVLPVEKPPSPPDFERHVLAKTPVDEIWAYINPRMLLGRHLGLSNSIIRFVEENRLAELEDLPQGKKALEILRVLDEVKEECAKRKLLAPKAVYRFFPASGEGNEIHVRNPNKEDVPARIPFPRQSKAPYLSVPDYLNPAASGRNDNVCLFVTTAGHGVRETSDEWKKKGEFLRSHVLSALALESAEAYAEWLHAKIRSLWNLPDPPSMTMMERFQARYPGKRYSFGYAACPNLENQQMLFDLLRPEDIGVTLTESFMMDPEASVSAVVIHHLQAAYFTA